MTVRVALLVLLVLALVVGGTVWYLSRTPDAPEVAATVVDVPVRASADDAEERSDGEVRLTSSDLNLAADDGSTQTVGIRFTDVPVPAGATITDAYVQFTVDEETTAESSLSIAGQASGDPATFSTAEKDISSRPRTTAEVTWTPEPWPAEDARTTAQRTPDLSTVVQEIVDRPDWAAGGPLALIITGTGERAADSFDGGAAKAPALHIEYTSAVPSDRAEPAPPGTTSSPAPPGTDGGIGSPPNAALGEIYGIEPEAHSHVPPYVDGNGNLYRVTEEYFEPVPDHNTPLMMKSSDGGRTWAEVDAANRPENRDLEGSWLLQAGTSLIYVHTNGDRVTYSEFRTSDDPATPDRWVVQDERAVDDIDAGSRQWACAARTSDDRTWVFFADTVVDGNFQLAYTRRNAPGSWTSPTRISTDEQSLAGATCVVDPATDVTHVFYHDYAEKQVLYRSLSPRGELSPAVRVDTTGTSPAERNYLAVSNPVVHTADGSTVVTALFASESGVRTVSVVDGEVAPEQVVDLEAPLISPDNIGRNTGNDGPVMHLAVDGSTLHALWADAETGDVWHSRRPHEGEWSTPTRLVDSGAGHVSWLYSNVYTIDGRRVLGYTTDHGPHEDDGGDIRYRQLPL